MTTLEPIRLRPEVELVRRDPGVTLLRYPPAQRTLRVSATGVALLPALAAGTNVDRLLTLLGRDRDAMPALTAFLDRLRAAGMLAGSEATPGPAMRRLKPLVNLNPPARALARPLRALPVVVRRALVVVMVGVAIGGLAALASARGLPHFTSVVRGFDLWAMLWLILVHIPIHELGHAVASHVAGTPVSSAGVMFGRFGIPTAYVLTTEAYRIRERLPRVWISAAGPLVDLLAAGAAAWLALAAEGAVAHAASYFVFLALITFVANLNPWAASDGSHALQAALNDERLRHAARGRRDPGLSSPRGIRIYRVARLAYLAGLTLAMVLVWRWS